MAHVSTRLFRLTRGEAEFQAALDRNILHSKVSLSYNFTHISESPSNFLSSNRYCLEVTVSSTCATGRCLPCADSSVSNYCIVKRVRRMASHVRHSLRGWTSWPRTPDVSCCHNCSQYEWHILEILLALLAQWQPNTESVRTVCGTSEGSCQRHSKSSDDRITVQIQNPEPGTLTLRSHIACALIS